MTDTPDLEDAPRLREYLELLPIATPAAAEEMDVAMKGHHHSPAFHKVMNAYPVFSAPSPKPGGEFPSRIGKPDVSRHADLGWVFGVSDERPVTWQFLLDDQ